MSMRIPRCLNCGGHLEQKASGRPRKFCSDRCRVAHKRREARAQQMAAETVGYDMQSAGRVTASATELVGLPADPDEAVVSAVKQAHAAAHAMGIAGRVARPQLAWRCERAADAIAAAIKRYFPSE